jgi:archaellum biogenesis ATPase FlaH
MKENDHLVLISGKSSTGKSASLMGIKNPEGVIYGNCENNKKLPFKSKFKEFTVTDPLQVYQIFEEAENMPDVHTIVVDSLTYLMDMYETVYVLPATNSMKEWGNYAQYFKRLMSQYVAKSSKNIFFTAHTSDIMNEVEMTQETLVKVKGSLMNTGIESFYSTVISSKKVPIKNLKNYSNNLLNITPEEESLGFKYVYQTRLTKETVNERMRSPLGMWSTQETFIDNNLQLVMDRLHEYYD